jgi:predicted alpha/beta-fold hydrolase
MPTLPTAPVLEPPRPYQPAWWLPGAHVQTVVGKFLRPRTRIPLVQEEWETPDGDLLELVLGPDPGGRQPVVLVLHGLEGNVRRGYVQLTLQALLKGGALPLALNFRGCGGTPNRRPRFYHSGDTTDVAFVLEELGRRFPGRPVGVVAYSLGGNMLLRYLGEGAMACPGTWGRRRPYRSPTTWPGAPGSWSRG